jgi:hypothetical protein
MKNFIIAALPPPFDPSEVSNEKFYNWLYRDPSNSLFKYYLMKICKIIKNNQDSQSINLVGPSVSNIDLPFYKRMYAPKIENMCKPLISKDLGRKFGYEINDFIVDSSSVWKDAFHQMKLILSLYIPDSAYTRVVSFKVLCKMDQNTPPIYKIWDIQLIGASSSEFTVIR